MNASLDVCVCVCAHVRACVRARVRLRALLLVVGVYSVVWKALGARSREQGLGRGCVRVILLLVVGIQTWVVSRSGCSTQLRFAFCVLAVLNVVLCMFLEHHHH